MSPDFLNGLFELVGGMLIWLSVYRLYKDKEVKGVSVFPVAFFAAWGYWNIYYYAAIDQWFSWAAGLSIVLANTVWMVQLFYYCRKAKRGN